MRLSALGDVIHTWPLAQPELHLTWIVEEPLRPLVEGHPAVDRVLTTATRRWRRRPLAPSTLRDLARLRRDLRGTLDVCLDPQGVLKSALVTAASGAARRFGWAPPWRRELLTGAVYTHTLAPPPEAGHIVARNLEFVRAVGGAPPHPTPAPDGTWLLAPKPDALAPNRRDAAVLLPGAGQPGKILAVEVLATIARGLAERGLTPIVAWGPGERVRAEAVVAGADHARLAPPTDLLELAHLLGAARLVVGGDTGPVHLAASLGTPTLGVFIASDPVRNGPLGACATTVSNLTGQAAAGARARVRRASPVTADDVLLAADRLLRRGAQP